MEANITGENDERVGLYVDDNNGVEHWIEIQFDGEIKYHEQDGYPDKAAKRTPEGNEHVSQARRYAKWHVYRERGYDTISPPENPDRILAALVAIARLPEDVFNEQFGDLQAQIESHYDNTPVDLPFPDADPDDVLVYRKDVYVQPDPIEFEPPVLDQYLGHFEGESGSPEIPSKGTLDSTEFDTLNFEIEAVSDMHYLHMDGPGSEQTKRSADPLEREPDATIELVPFDPDEIESFHHYVVSHLAYQIRDCFLRVGVKPPVAFRQTGWGKYRAFHEQKFRPQYENYWDATADIQSWEPK
ncbi:hypothetical protein [Haloferax larsenii]|uniref:Uncharacterized protein n=1 Tax=Haloferax larsenii TaxID=302484 RepID=A0A1H7T237_HALLR|nr:hypothetical protein [Haloferax larsenii]SEL78941.1 hypothetical protein SAMN04488691_10842 [Haloferax larsenii]